MRRIAMVAVLLLAGAADAQTLYKCVSSDGPSYQQTPCPPSARTVLSIQTVPEPPPTATQLAERLQKAQQDRAESAFLSHQAGIDQRFTVSAYRSPRRTANRDKRKSACDAAKTSRKRTLRAVGLDRNLDLLRRLDDDVEDACAYR